MPLAPLASRDFSFLLRPFENTCSQHLYWNFLSDVPSEFLIWQNIRLPSSNEETLMSTQFLAVTQHQEKQEMRKIQKEPIS